MRLTSIPSLRAACLAALLCTCSWVAVAAKPAAHRAHKVPRAHAAHRAHAVPSPPTPDLSGKRRVGTASVYSSRLAGRRMADGTRLDLQSHAAASRTLPLGTRARVTNLRTGRSAVVVIRDRGPYAKGRIADLSPRTARAIGLEPHEGVAPVEIVPLSLPDVRLGAGEGVALALSDGGQGDLPRE